MSGCLIWMGRGAGTQEEVRFKESGVVTRG